MKLGARSLEALSSLHALASASCLGKAYSQSASIGIGLAVFGCAD